MALSAPTGLGFAGVGWLGEALIKDLPGFPQLRLAAVQDAHPQLAREVGARHAAERVFESYEALLAEPGVDAVVICTPNAFHGPQARAALEAGKHVLVQKPLALSAMDAVQTVRAAVRANRVLFVDYSYRFLETTGLLRTALARIGRPRSLRAAFRNIYGPGKAWFFDPALSGGGALTDLGVHLIDLALALLQPRSAVLEWARLGYTGGHPVEDAAELQVRLDQVPLRLAVSWNEPRPLTDISLEITGDAGVLRWENVDGSFFRFRTTLNGESLLEQETTLRADTLRAFARALEAPVEMPVPDPRVYALVEAAYREASSEHTR
ncbi:MAG: Gfo/Idh/MocA family oxidoreductase [Chloroflexi bacterium]|nr:Gfo/Idh/MocA family oxidoreductase [Chloroflexota bacterium]